MKLAVIRGNLSEIKTLYGIQSKTKGVDSCDSVSENGNELTAGKRNGKGTCK